MDELKGKLENVIRDLYGLDFDVEITPAPANIEADYSSNVAMKLAKTLHKNPMEIAKEISEKCSAEILPPGFLNFTVADEALKSEISEVVENFEQWARNNEFAEKTVVCEFSDPNPFKVLHVGHLYTSVVGDAISRLYEYAGARVVRANFGGDVGLHVAKTMYALMREDFDNLTIEDIAKCYIEGTAAYDDDAEAHDEITRLNKEIYRINAEDIHDTELARLYWRGRELSYEYFEKFYESIGVKFDKFYPESTVAELGLSKVREQLERGVYEYSDGAVIFDGEKYGLHTRVFINREGVPTYETKDVGLIFTKERDWHFDKSVVITGSEQLDYMKVVLKSVEQYAPELVERTAHLTHGLVKLPGGVKMSSRKGNFLKAVDVISMVQEELAHEYNSHDEKVVMGALKYAFLKYKMGGDIIFDPKESVKMTGNSGPYLLYSSVRAKKILALVTDAFSERSLGPVVTGLGRSVFAPSANMLLESTMTKAERSLAKKVLEYRGMLAEAVREMAPHKVATYLYEVSQEFSRFYEDCPVVGTKEEYERARLVRAYLAVMEHGLGLMGIKIPEKM